MDPFMIVGLVAGAVCTAILFPITRARHRSPWWSLLGIIGLIGFGIALAVLFIGKPGNGWRHHGPAEDVRAR